MNSSPRMKGLLEMDNDVRKSDKKRRVEKEASDRELPSRSTLHPVTDGIPQNAILSPNRKPAFPLASALPKSSLVTSYSSKSPSHSSTSPRKEGSSARVNRRKVGSAPHLMFPNEYSAEQTDTSTICSFIFIFLNKNMKIIHNSHILDNNINPIIHFEFHKF